MVIHTIAATQEVPRHTRLDSRGSTRVLPTSRGAPFPPHTREEGSFPAWSGKNSRRSRRMSRGGSLHRKGERNSRVGPPFPESPRCLSIPGKPVFPALPRLSSRGSTHTTVARGTDLWESLVGKLRGKASRESHRSLDPRERKSDTAATPREESARACPH